jgi:hypothetical protein
MSAAVAAPISQHHGNIVIKARVNNNEYIAAERICGEKISSMKKAENALSNARQRRDIGIATSNKYVAAYGGGAVFSVVIISSK